MKYVTIYNIRTLSHGTSDLNDIEVLCSDGENSTQTDTVMFVITEAPDLPADKQQCVTQRSAVKARAVYIRKYKMHFLF